MRTGSPKRLPRITLLSELKFDNSALQTDHRGLSSVVGAQFREDVPDLALDGFFADGELGRNLFVGIPFGNQTQHPDFRRGKRVIGGMLGKLVGSLSGKRLLPGMNRANRFQQFLMQAILEQVSASASF